MALAQAIFDNSADAQGELSFIRGDVLAILEKNPYGLEGWWLCTSAEGQHGIAPANRLKELPTASQVGLKMTGTKFTPQTPDHLQNSQTADGDYDSPLKVTSSTSSDYDIPKSRKVKNQSIPHLAPIQLQAIEELYDYPQQTVPSSTKDNSNSDVSNRSSGVSNISIRTSGYSSYYESSPVNSHGSYDLSGHDLYDIPKASQNALSPKEESQTPADTVKLLNQDKQYESDSYDIPKPYTAYGSDYCDIDEKTPTNISGSFDDLKDAVSARKGNRSGGPPLLNIMKSKPKSTAADPPPDRNRLSAAIASETVLRHLPSLGSNQSTLSSQSLRRTSKEKILPATAESIVELLKRKNTYLVRCCSKLLAYASHNWFLRENLEQKVFDMKMAVVALKDALVDFVEIMLKIQEQFDALEEEGSYSLEFGNITKNLVDALNLMENDIETLSLIEWDVDKLTEDGSLELEALKRLIKESSAVIGKVKDIISYVQGNYHSFIVDAQTEGKNLENLHQPQKFAEDQRVPVEVSSDSSEEESGLNINKSMDGASGPAEASVTSPGVKALVGMLEQHGNQKKVKPPATQPKPVIKNKPGGQSVGKESQVDDVNKSEVIKAMSGSSATTLPSAPAGHRSLNSLELQEAGGDYDIPVPQSAFSPDPNSEFDNAPVTRPVHELEGYKELDEYIDLTPTPQKGKEHPLISDKSQEKEQEDRIYDSPPSCQGDYNVLPVVSTLGLRKSLENLMEQSGSGVTRSWVADGTSNGTHILTRETQSMFDLCGSDSNRFDVHGGDSNRSSLSSRSSGSSSRPGSQLTTAEKEALLFFNVQLENQSTVLMHALTSLRMAVTQAQPPRLFTAHSKFVVVAAHKLAYIGDAASRQVVAGGVRAQIISDSNQLCESLKALVVKTKQAALNFPADDTQRDMLSCVQGVEVSTHRLKETFASCLVF